MKKTIKLTALAMASTLAGTAHAAPTSELSQEVLRSIMRVDVPEVHWLNDSIWRGVNNYSDSLQVDAGRTKFTGNPWVVGDEMLACDTWGGVLCVDGNITHLEIPFAEMNGDMGALMKALKPIAGSLKSLNVVGNTRLRGEANGLQDLTGLEGLYLDNTGVAGELPDLSAMTELRFAGLNDNNGLTGLAGGIGGAKLQTLNLNNTPNFTGDLTAVLEASKNSLQRLNLANSAAGGQIPDYSANTQLNYFVISGSGLGGQLNLPSSGQIAPGNIDTAGTGVTAGTGTEGVDITPVVATVANVSAAANGANAMLVSWAPASGADGYIVAYSNDGGQNWSAETLAGGNTSSAVINGLAAGSYAVSVTAYATNAAGITVQSSPTRAPGTVEISDANVVGPETVDGTGDGETQEPVIPAVTGGKIDGGGGAVFWLALAPLAALGRRKRS